MVVHWAETPGSLHLFRKKVGLPMPLPSRYAIKRRVLKGVSLRLLKKIIFVNAITRTAYIELYRVPSGRCVTIYNGIQPEYFRDLEITREGVRGALGVKSGEYMVLAAGNLAEVKGYKYLISAIYDLVEKGIPIKCFIAGQGELKEELEKQIMSLELDRNVKLLGYRDDIPSLLTAADIFCMPSLNEALGYSLLEAMAAGIPVIASNVGGIPEALTDGKEGLLVPSGDVRELSLAIQKLISDDELAKRLGLNGRHTVNQTFSLERMLTQTRDFLLNDLQI
jgi:glycosyltransferase involved in cell wall biosynthesis